MECPSAAEDLRLPRLRKNDRGEMDERRGCPVELLSTTELLPCRHFDPDFGRRDPMDRSVCPEKKDTAAVYMGAMRCGS